MHFRLDYFIDLYDLMVGKLLSEWTRKKKWYQSVSIHIRITWMIFSLLEYDDILWWHSPLTKIKWNEIIYRICSRLQVNLTQLKFFFQFFFFLAQNWNKHFLWHVFSNRQIKNKQQNDSKKIYTKWRWKKSLSISYI